MRLEPDGLLGAIVGSESLGIANTMINGAGGCRSRAQIMLHDLMPEYQTENANYCDSKYFSFQSRLPCTYINNNDVVFGTSSKVFEGVSSVSDMTGMRTVLLDTLGASLICTDYTSLSKELEEAIIIRGDLSSMSFSEGYDSCIRTILETMELNSGETKQTVNLLGYGIQDPGWKTGEMELRHLLETMGVKVNCIMGCRPGMESIKSSAEASLNIMVHPECCKSTARMMHDRFGIPSLRPSLGAPIGFDATRSFLKEIANELDVDPSPALDIVDDEEEDIRSILMNFDKLPRSLHARGFTIDADSSTAYPLLKWMFEVFSMAPRKITITDDEYSTEIQRFLSEQGFDGAIQGLEGRVDMEFTNGLTALEGRLRNDDVGHVEVRLPRGRQLDLLGRTIVGTKGCRYILDEMFNSMTVFRCGQPANVDRRPCCNR